MTENARSCPVCRTAVPEGANYCPGCGLQLAHGYEHVAYASPTPKLFGVVSPTAAFVLACVLLLVGVAAAVAASWVLTIIVLAASAAVFVLFYGAAERDPSGAVARGVLAANDRLRAGVSTARSSVRAWSSAGRDVFRLRRELRALRHEREQLRPALGEAAYRDDESVMSTLRARMHEIDEAVASRERARDETVARARSRVDEERVSGRPTEVLAPAEEAAGDEDEPH